MSRIALVAVAVGLIATASAQAAASAGKRTFYLTVKPHQCLIAGSKRTTGSYKIVLVVPCSNARHQFEVYAVRHGGWGHRAVPLRTVERGAAHACTTAYRALTSHAFPSGSGWDAFAPDPGAEQRRYGDKIVCSYVHHPVDTPLGSGWHVR